VRCVKKTTRNASACVGKQLIVTIASTEHSYWLALAFLAVFVYATHATQAIAFEWKPGLSLTGVNNGEKTVEHFLP